MKTCRCYKKGMRCQAPDLAQGTIGCSCGGRVKKGGSCLESRGLKSKGGKRKRK
jgi:hypothetical protein